MSSNKQKKAELRRRQQRRTELERLDELREARSEGRLINNEIIVPRGAVIADTTRQRSCSAIWTPKLWYEDMPFVCRDCGRKEVWTAEQQKWWYEHCQGNLESIAIRCGSCRKDRGSDSTEVTF